MQSRVGIVAGKMFKEGQVLVFSKEWEEMKLSE